MGGFMILGWGLLIIGIIVSKSIKRGGRAADVYDALKEIIQEKVRSVKSEEKRDLAVGLILFQYLKYKNSHEFKLMLPLLKELLMDEIREDKLKTELYAEYLERGMKRAFISPSEAKKELTNFEADITRLNLEKAIK